MILDGKKLSKKLNSKIKKEIDLNGYKPKVVDILIGEKEENEIYVRNKEKICNEVGIDFKIIKLESNEDMIIKTIDKLNKDSNVHGIMIQLPIPDYLNKDKIINEIIPSKDIDGLTNINKVDSEDGLISCTAKAILKILDEYKISVKNKNVVIIGKGELVGKPIKKLLENRKANITICDSKTNDLKKYTINSDIIIAATNKADIINKDMVKENTVIIDAGIIYKDGLLYGNVSKDLLDEKIYITPVPGGIGPVTISMFLENIIICYKNIKCKE